MMVLYPVSRHFRVLQMVIKLSNGAKITAIYLVLTICILRNSCKRCAIIIVLFIVGGVITMEMECLWLFFGVCRTQLLPLLDPGVYVVVSNQNSFKTPRMHTF